MKLKGQEEAYMGVFGGRKKEGINNVIIMSKTVK